MDDAKKKPEPYFSAYVIAGEIYVSHPYSGDPFGPRFCESHVETDTALQLATELINAVMAARAQAKEKS